MVGGVIGVGVSGFLSDKFGRKRILMLGSLLFFICALISAMSILRQYGHY